MHDERDTNTMVLTYKDSPADTITIVEPHKPTVTEAPPPPVEDIVVTGQDLTSLAMPMAFGDKFVIDFDRALKKGLPYDSAFVNRTGKSLHIVQTGKFYTILPPNTRATPHIVDGKIKTYVPTRLS